MSATPAAAVLPALTGSAATVAAADVAPAPYLSVVIPAFNEERRLGPTLRAVLAYLGARPYTSEVIVVSDGSTDGTEQVAQEAFRAASGMEKVRTRFLDYFPNRGKGKAVRTGVTATHGTFVAFADADLSTPIEEVDRALAFMEGGAFSVVIGSRAADDASVERRQPLYRRLSARLFNVLRDRIAGIRGLRDTQCGLKVFEGEVARAIFGRQRVDGFMFDVETMYIAQRLGLPIREMGVRWADAPESKVRLSSGFRLVPDLLRIRLAHQALRPSDLPLLVRSARNEA